MNINKNVSVWRGDTTPPTKYHLWIKSDGTLYIFDGYTWTKVLDLVTKELVGLGNVTNDALVKRSEMGVAEGVATLDSGGKIPSEQLPSYVDDILEYESNLRFPNPGEQGKIYVSLDTGRTYRWSGSLYIEIAKAPNPLVDHSGNSKNYIWSESGPDKDNPRCVITTKNTKFRQTYGNLLLQLGLWCPVAQNDDGMWWAVDVPNASLSADGAMSKDIYKRLSSAGFYAINKANQTIVYYPNYAKGGTSFSFALNPASHTTAGVMTAGDKEKLDSLTPFDPTDLENKISSVQDLVTSIHTAISASASANPIEKGISTPVNINTSVRFNNSQNLTHTKEVRLTRDGDPISLPHNIDNTTTFYVTINVDNTDPKLIMSVERTVTVNAYYPKYYGRVDKDTLTGADVIALPKVGLSNSIATERDFTSNIADYLWLCVPNDRTISSVSSGGFAVSMNSPISVEVSGKGTYKCYRSHDKLNAGTVKIKIS